MDQTTQDLDASSAEPATKPARWAWLMLAGILVALVGAASLGLRIHLVNLGVLYGSASVARVDGITAGVFGFGMALIAFALSRRARSKQPTSPAARSFNDRVAALTAIASVIAVIVSTVNLFVPVELPSRAKPACPGAQDRAAPYTGITAGPSGNNSRSGPARSFPPNGRFPTDCSIGFSGYCLGDPIVDSSGTISDHQVWVTSRWLIVAKQPGGWRATAAHILSGENSEPQYITDANITPETNFAQLPEAPASQCRGGNQDPGKATLQPFDTSMQTFTAQADHAANMGFAVWVPRTGPFIDPNSYYPMFNDSKDAADNPGATDAGGTKTVAWTYHEQLLANIPQSASATPGPAVVVVMAIPCLADNVPAKTNTAAIAAYDIGSASEPSQVNQVPTGFDRQRLANAACQANV